MKTSSTARKTKAATKKATPKKTATLRKSKTALKPAPTRRAKVFAMLISPVKARKSGTVKKPTTTRKGGAMKIETVKWKWADAVQNKEVYRDDEFVRTKTKEEALLAIDFLMNQAKGMTYTITVFRDGEYFTYFRHSMPCWGGLVKYRDSHGERYFMNPYFPRDIRVAYPEGDNVYIACHRMGLKASLESDYMKFILSQESPWVSAFGHRDTIIFKDNYFVLTNMNTDPTVLYSILRLGQFGYNGQGTTSKFHPKAYILGFMTSQADPRRLAGQKPIRISGGMWSEGYGYTRPYNESIFKTSLPHKLKDFGGLAGYPQAPYTNTYFVNTMKSEFGVDVTKFNYSLTITPKDEEKLLTAWDYFKEKAKELDE